MNRYEICHRCIKETNDSFDLMLPIADEKLKYVEEHMNDAVWENPYFNTSDLWIVNSMGLELFELCPHCPYALEHEVLCQDDE